MIALFSFCLLSLMLLMYVLLDGYDLGIATVMPWITKNSRERSQLIVAIGPVWGGNEVWLIAAGGALFAFFPQAYASSFSGFYLPFTMVLWLFMARGMALELRNHLQGALWQRFWDTAFITSSLLLVLLFGVALGNLLRGLPLNAQNYFTGSFASLLNPYALGVGLLAIASLAQHGLSYTMMRVGGQVGTRSRQAVKRLWVPLLLFYFAMTVATYTLHRNALTQAALQHEHLSDEPLLAAVLFIGSSVALLIVRIAVDRRNGRLTFIASSSFLSALFASSALAMYPYLIPAYPFGSGGLTITAATPSSGSVVPILVLVCCGLVGVVAYRLVTTSLLRASLPTSSSDHAADLTLS